MTGRASTDWADWARLILRPTRERLGLSRRQLARQAKVGANAITRLETGMTRRPTLRMLRGLCNALDLPLPGHEGLYLSLDGVAADTLRRLAAAALYEFARRRRDAAHFASLIHLPSTRAQHQQATANVAAERDLATDLLGLLCPELDGSAPDPLPNRPPPNRRTRLPPRRNVASPDPSRSPVTVFKVVYAIVERGPKKHWLRIGLAFA